MKKQKEEAEKYTGLQERRKGLQQRASLLKLFSIEREVAISSHLPISPFTSPHISP